MSQEMSVAREVLVLGGGTDGDLAVAALRALDYRVHWVMLGETAEERRADDDPGLVRYDDCELLALEGQAGAFTARLRRNGQPLFLGAAAVVVAVGNVRYDPREGYGLPSSERVLTAPQLASRLADIDALEAKARRVGIVLDLGAESSKEAFGEAVGLALALREERRCEVLVFYRNLKVDTYNLELQTREMRQSGVVFCRYGTLEIAADDSGVTLTYEEGKQHVDWLAVPEESRPRDDTPALAQALRVRLGADGYLQEVNVRHYRPGLSPRRGVFYAGRCHLDGDDGDAAADAAQAAARVDALIGSGRLAPEPIVAYVDSSVCIRCLTCVRTCPHAAVEVVTREEVTAAEVLPLACWGCGACASNCPVRAITLEGKVLPAWAATA